MELYHSKVYLDETPSLYESLQTFCYCMYSFLDQYFYELKERIDSPYIIQYGIMLIHEVFLTSLYHTRNLETSKNTVKQAIQYYTEYLSQIYSQYLKLNPTDAYRFVLKKTLQLIPLQRRQNSLEKSNVWFSVMLPYFDLWTTWATFSISYYQTIWLNHPSNYLHEKYRNHFNCITDIIQQLINHNNKHLYNQIEWHQTIISLNLNPDSSLNLATKYINTCINIPKFREHWFKGDFSIKHHNQMDKELEYSLSDD